MIAPNSYVPAGSRIPHNTLWGGNPVQFVKNLEQSQDRLQDQPEVIKVELVEEGRIL